MHGKRIAIVGVISGLLVAASGTVGFGFGRDAATARAPVPRVTTVGAEPAAVAAGAGAASVAVGSVPPASARVGVDKALPFPGPDFPGLPPYPGTMLGDGVQATGVAFRKTDNPDAKPGRDLVEQAFADGAKRAQELAEASNVKLGGLLAVNDVRQTQPVWRACVEPLAGSPAEIKPPSPDQSQDLIAPAPECSPSYYLVVWVFLRYEIA